MYLETSVFGGCFDEGFEAPSRALIESVRNGEAIAVISDILIGEVLPAPENIRSMFFELPEEFTERVDADETSLELCQAYIEAGALGSASELDAHHVAIATLAEVDVIVSWNFKHIVNLNRIRRFHEVNRSWGLPFVEIRSPFEVGDWNE